MGRAAALSRSTDGVVINDANVTTWTTWDGNYDGRSDFVGLGYSEPNVFGVVKVDLGYQFGDGGDWSTQPRIFILKHPLDTNQRAPETDPDWVEVPASCVSGSMFDVNIDQPTGTTPLINSPTVFDLSQLPLAERTGWGWAAISYSTTRRCGRCFPCRPRARARYCYPGRSSRPAIRWNRALLWPAGVGALCRRRSTRSTANTRRR